MILMISILDHDGVPVCGTRICRTATLAAELIGNRRDSIGCNQLAGASGTDAGYTVARHRLMSIPSLSL